MILSCLALDGIVRSNGASPRMFVLTAEEAASYGHASDITLCFPSNGDGV